MKTLKNLSFFLILLILTACVKKKKAPFLKHEKVYLKSETRKKVDTKLDSLVNDATAINRKTFSLADLNNDDLLDVVVFLELINKEDDFFKETMVIYYENTGYDLVLKQNVSFSRLLIEPEDRISDESTHWVNNLVFAKITDLSNYEGSKEGSVNLRNSDGKITYGININEKNDNLDTFYKIRKVNYYRYVTAKSGLNYRNRPISSGEVLGKFPYRTFLLVIGETNMNFTVNDDGKEISGRWLQVTLDDSGEETVFVFDGFLGKEYDLN